jgi:tRNA A-37 threonylcarbamoyl transferase component Bud32
MIAMPFVLVNPRYRELLNALGLRGPEQFLALPSVVVSGHPDRHVARTMLGSLPAYLKREHRVPWRDRLASWLAGFGWATKSQREAMTLQSLVRAGVGCPEWIACGQDKRGRAFLLLSALTDAVELRWFLYHSRNQSLRRDLARRLGIALACMHNAGFNHGDLYSKHIFVSNDGSRVQFLDWQRSRRGQVAERQRIRDLAALDATLAEVLASVRERLACLRAYLNAHKETVPLSSRMQSPILPKDRKRLVTDIRREASHLLRKRHVHRARLLPSADAQELVWLDGEALCVTPDLLQELNGDVPIWLSAASGSGVQTSHQRVGSGESQHSVVLLPSGRRALLVHSRRNQPLRWLWSEFRRKKLITSEVREAGLLLRRQHLGQSAPRLLAFGQRRQLPWRTESFLLPEVPTIETGTAPLSALTTRGCHEQ